MRNTVIDENVYCFKYWMGKKGGIDKSMEPTDYNQQWPKIESKVLTLKKERKKEKSWNFEKLFLFRSREYKHNFFFFFLRAQALANVSSNHTYLIWALIHNRGLKPQSQCWHYKYKLGENALPWLSKLKQDRHIRVSFTGEKLLI